MSVSLAHEVRATGTPVYCSACFAQDPSKLHVDLDAACDRGYGDRDDGLKIAMDDLVLCESCVRSAGVIVGMRDATELEQELEGLRKLHRQEKDRGDSLEHYLDQLEGAFASRPEPIIAPRRRGRPPREDE